MGQTDRDRVRWRARDETRRKRMRVREERPREPADGAHGALMGRMGRTGALNWETAAKQTDLSGSYMYPNCLISRGGAAVDGAPVPVQLLPSLDDRGIG